MRYSGEHKAKTRERVLREAARELRDRGCENVSIGRVMERAGLTHGGFYAHFASRDDLVSEAVGAMFADARGRLPVGAADDPKAALRGYIEGYLGAAHRDNRERGCPLPTLSGDLARADRATRERFESGVTTLAARLAEPLRAIGNADPDAAATAMLSEMVGAVALSRAVADPARSDAILAAARADLIARHGLENPS